MKSKQLEENFNIHFARYPDYVNNEIPECMIYGEDEFHINAKQKTIFLKGVGVVKSPNLEDTLPYIGWVALVPNQENNSTELVMGNGNPFDDAYLDVLPTRNGVIIAVPRSIVARVLGK